MPQYLSPVCNDQTIDANGDPLVGGQIETYLAGSSTPAATYTDDSGSTPHSNPIVLNSLGYPTQGSIWLTGGVSYKFIIKSASGVTLRTIDEIAGINDATLSQSEWLESGFTPTYINGTTFSVPGDQTGTLQINRRVRTQNTSGFIYSSISNSVFAAGITTVTLINDLGVLDAGLSSVAFGLLSATNPSVPAISVTNFTMGTARILGRETAGNGPVQELTASQALAIMGVTNSVFQTGDVMFKARSSTPAGWVRMDGNSIGSASSGATARANADTLALFTHLWTDFPNTVLVIQTSAGANTTRGASAAADFAANKRMPVFDTRGNVIRDLDEGRGYDSGRVNGSQQLDAFQDHQHEGLRTTYFNAGVSPGGNNNMSSPGTTDGSPIARGASGTPRLATETRMKNIAFLAFIKL